MSKLSKEDRRRRDELERHGQNLSAIVTIAVNVIRTAGWVLIAGIGYMGLTVVAGRNTRLEIVADVLSTLSDYGISWAVVLGVVAVMIAREKIGGSTIRRLSSRLKQLETFVDSDRSSSRLTETGKTRPEDDP